MLSGIWPRGSNSAPGSGNTGMISGSSPGPRYSALIGIWRSRLDWFARLVDVQTFDLAKYKALRKQDGRQPLSSFNRGLVRGAPRLEELHQLLSRAVLIPFAVALDDLEQLLGCLGALAAGVERGREVEPCLVVERVRGDFLFQLGHGTERLGLLRQVDGGLHGAYGGVIAFRFRDHGQRLFGPFDGAGGHVASG